MLPLPPLINSQYWLLAEYISWSWSWIRAVVAEWIARRTHNPRVVGSTPVQVAGCILGKGTWALFPRLPRGALNRGAVCVRMHLRSCTDVKEPGWPSESLGVQKQTDRAGMHKRPKDGMWLPTGGQIGNGHIRVSSLAQGERCKQASKVGGAWGRVVEIHWYIKIDRTYLNKYIDIFCWMQSMHSLGFENAFPSSLLICFYGCLRRIDRLHIKMIAKLTKNQNVFMGVVRVVSSRNSGCYIILETSRLTRIAKLSKKGGGRAWKNMRVRYLNDASMVKVWKKLTVRFSFKKMLKFRIFPSLFLLIGLNCASFCHTFSICAYKKNSSETKNLREFYISILTICAKK